MKFPATCHSYIRFQLVLMLLSIFITRSCASRRPRKKTRNTVLQRWSNENSVDKNKRNHRKKRRNERSKRKKISARERRQQREELQSSFSSLKENPEGETDSETTLCNVTKPNKDISNQQFMYDDCSIQMTEIAREKCKKRIDRN